MHELALRVTVKVVAWMQKEVTDYTDWVIPAKILKVYKRKAPVAAAISDPWENT